MGRKADMPAFPLGKCVSVNARRRICAVHLHTQIKCVRSTQKICCRNKCKSVTVKSVAEMCQCKRSINRRSPCHHRASHLLQMCFVLMVQFYSACSRLTPNPDQQTSLSSQLPNFLHYFTHSFYFVSRSAARGRLTNWASIRNMRPYF